MSNDRLPLKRAIGGMWRGNPLSRPRRIILLYHAVGEGPWAIPRKEFAQQMEWLAREARPISLVRALEGESEKKLEIAISFDDGYASVFEHALPVIKTNGLSAAVFVNTAWIGEEERTASDQTLGHYPGEAFLLWRELDALLDRGWVLGSHGEHHLQHWRESDSIVWRELVASKKRLETLTPGDCVHFAYTWGRSTARLRQLVAKAGYRWGLAAVHGPVCRRSDPFAVPRINIDRGYSLDDFKAIVRGDWDYLRFIQNWRGAQS